MGFVIEIKLEPEDEESIPSTANSTLYILLDKMVHKEKPLFCTIASFKGAQRCPLCALEADGMKN